VAPFTQVMDILEARKRRGLPNPFEASAHQLPGPQWFSSFFSRHGIVWRSPLTLTSRYKQAARNEPALREWFSTYEQVCRRSLHLEIVNWSLLKAIDVVAAHYAVVTHSCMPLHTADAQHSMHP
jgi:hypothetical protein